ncbi:MAG: phosphonate metabolism protein/1,5-bisphosphokinase (PRPP-forming) PhnN [Bauldia sp.]
MIRGALVAVVGPSGAGKDTLISHARDTLLGDARYLFVRRVVTRPAGPFEDHDTTTEAEFTRREANGDFALSWRAHGLSYGVPLAVLGAVEGGVIAVCNLSRGALSDARRRFPRVVTLLVTAPNAVIAARLAARGRESEEEAARRLDRESRVSKAISADRVVSNDSTREEGGRKFVLCLERIRSEIAASVAEPPRPGAAARPLTT